MRPTDDMQPTISTRAITPRDSHDSSCADRGRFGAAASTAFHGAVPTSTLPSHPSCGVFFRTKSLPAEPLTFRHRSCLPRESPRDRYARSRPTTSGPRERARHLSDPKRLGDLRRACRARKKLPNASELGARDLREAPRHSRRRSPSTRPFRAPSEASSAGRDQLGEATFDVTDMLTVRERDHTTRTPIPHETGDPAPPAVARWTRSLDSCPSSAVSEAR